MTPIISIANDMPMRILIKIIINKEPLPCNLYSYEADR